MTAESAIDLTPDQLAFIRAAAARWRMDEAGPMMLEALRKAQDAMNFAMEVFKFAPDHSWTKKMADALLSCSAAIAAAE